jgi:hypothetical protein
LVVVVHHSCVLNVGVISWVHLWVLDILHVVASWILLHVVWPWSLLWSAIIWPWSLLRSAVVWTLHWSTIVRSLRASDIVRIWSLGASDIIWVWTHRAIISIWWRGLWRSISRLAF